VPGVLLSTVPVGQASEETPHNRLSWFFAALTVSAPINGIAVN